MTHENRPYSPRFNDHYWSASGGASEKTHVFLLGNNLPERFTAATIFTVAELGFGTGLNFILTSRLWQQLAPANTHLTYIGYERFPFTPQELANLHPYLPPHLTASFESGWNTRTHANITLHLFVGSALQGITTQPGKANAWFLDGFTPSKNPDMWVPELLHAVAHQTAAQGTFATYTAARSVKDALTVAGFSWQRKKGHPPKQHMLVGQLT